MTELPYDFDLLFDIKNTEELANMIHRGDATKDLYEMMLIHKIPWPSKFPEPDTGSFTMTKEEARSWLRKHAIAGKVADIYGMRLMYVLGLCCQKHPNERMSDDYGLHCCDNHCSSGFINMDTGRMMPTYFIYG